MLKTHFHETTDKVIKIIAKLPSLWDQAFTEYIIRDSACTLERITELSDE